MDGTASLANGEIGRVLPANYRKVPFSGAVDHLNKAASARYFGQLSRESLETRTRWRSEADSNPRCREVFMGRIRPDFGAAFGTNKSIPDGVSVCQDLAQLRISLVQFPFVHKIMLGIRWRRT